MRYRRYIKPKLGKKVTRKKISILIKKTERILNREKNAIKQLKKIRNRL